MEEKELIKSKTSNVSKFTKICLIIFGVLLVTTVIYYLANIGNCRVWESSYYGTMRHSFFNFIFECFCFSEGFLMTICVYVGPVLLIVGLLAYWMYHNTGLTVTNKRIYGISKFGKRVDLPVDSVSAVSLGMFKSLCVATSSGKIVFSLMSNRDEVHKCISNLIIERQEKPQSQVNSSSDTKGNNIEKIKQYKELLDTGVITQEEFDAKKKQLLGL